VPDLSRREFIAGASAVAAAWKLPFDQVGGVLAAPAAPNTTDTTLTRTITQASRGTKQYRPLVTAAGEPFVVRLDVIGRTVSDARVAARRSLCYLGHFSDIHIMDAQSPARLEPMAGQSPTLWAGTVRPQDTLTTHVAAAMVESMVELRTSPVTGAAMSAAFVTGDSADMISDLELRWYIDLLDGTTLTANSGKPGVYEGVQVWPEATYAYHPDDPSIDHFGEYGFPSLPGLLEAAVSKPVVSPGSATPWYTVYGNHDTLYLGTLRVDAGLRSWAVGDRKASTWQALAGTYVGGLASDASAFQRFFDKVVNEFQRQPGIRAVTADPARKLLEQGDFMKAHLDSPATPGPVGHGFTQQNVDSGRTWWTADVGPVVRLFGLDTCNQIAGPDGAVPQDQFDWLAAGLAQCVKDKRLAVVLSHHNSTTLENDAAPAVGTSQRLVHADEFIAMLLDHPACVAWVNGHTHINTIFAHRRPDGKGGFWEITTASCIDFPQQQQTIEIVDNRDGTLSLFTVALDHTGPATATVGDFTQRGLAAWSRELSANDWVENPLMRRGSPQDRNCELLLESPFELAAVADADLAREQLALKARFLAYDAKERAK
jgi:metallophosphoesterase (TIGR03767 family)